MRRALLFVLVCCGCGYPKPRLVDGSDTVYQLQYCQKEKDCFDAAAKTCPNGFRVTKYGARPEEFICE